MGQNEDGIVMAALIVVIVFVIYMLVQREYRQREYRQREDRSGGWHADAARGGRPRPRPRPEGFEVSADSMIEGPQRRSVAESLSRLYNTEDVDPLVMSASCGGQEVIEGPLIIADNEISGEITGGLYVNPGSMRHVYTGRTALGKQGLSEFATGNSGELGVDVGPYGLYEQGGKIMGYDDGIPEQWKMPESPIRWYEDAGYDNYTADGPVPFKGDAPPLWVPDHLKLLGEDYAGTKYAAEGG
jgi:hypothetical protein